MNQCPPSQLTRSTIDDQACVKHHERAETREWRAANGPGNMVREQGQEFSGRCHSFQWDAVPMKNDKQTRWSDGGERPASSSKNQSFHQQFIRGHRMTLDDVHKK
jgi:hypothetical protein